MVNRKRRDDGDVLVVVVMRIEEFGERVVRAVLGPKSGRVTAMTLVYREEWTARTPVRSGTVMAGGHAEPAVLATEVPCHGGFRANGRDTAG